MRVDNTRLEQRHGYGVYEAQHLVPSASSPDEGDVPSAPTMCRLLQAEVRRPPSFDPCVRRRRTLASASKDNAHGRMSTSHSTRRFCDSWGRPTTPAAADRRARNGLLLGQCRARRSRSRRSSCIPDARHLSPPQIRRAPVRTDFFEPNSLPMSKRSETV
jgi:hypothetical protein